MTIRFYLSALLICSTSLLNAKTASKKPSDKVVKSINQKKIAPAKKTTSKRIDIDKIVARVNGVNILASDLKKPRIAKAGLPFSLDEAIFEELMYQRASQMQMLPKEADINRQIVAFKIQNGLTNMTDQEFEDELKQGGFSLHDYKVQYGRMIAAENVKRSEISEKLIVTSQEVEDYYKKNPAYHPEQYKLKISSLTTSLLPEKDMLIKQNKLQWDDLGWIEPNNLSSQLTCVRNLKPGQTSEPIQSGDEYQLVTLVEKKEKQMKTLDEQYSEIQRTLQQIKQEDFIIGFEKELTSKASIIRL